MSIFIDRKGPPYDLRWFLEGFRNFLTFEKIPQKNKCTLECDIETHSELL